MKENAGRRSFIKNIGISSIGAALAPTAIVNAAYEEKKIKKEQKSSSENTSRKYNAAYTGEFLNRIAFPIGGLGAGMICMEGTGAISHVSVRNKPEIFNEPGMFAAISVKGIKNGVKLLEGPVPDWKKFGFKDAGNGAGGATTGLPHFHKASFNMRFPFGFLNIDDADLPLKVQVTGWSPFIPTDDDNSSLPVGAMEYKFSNTGKTTVDAIFSFNSKNFLQIEKGNNSILPMQNGFVLSEAGTNEKPFKSAFAIFTDEPNTSVDHCWFRGGWWDPLTMAWNTVKKGEITTTPPVEKDAPGASLFVPFKLAAGKEKLSG